METRSAQSNLGSQIVARTPLDSTGYSGNIMERVTLQDGRELVLKQVSPKWDWLSRATGDRGRIGSMWRRGLFDRFPSVIDHATVMVESADEEWSVFMHDVSSALLPDDRALDRSEVHILLSAMAEFHMQFWGESFPDLCSIEDRFRLLSPETARRETQMGNRVGTTLTRGWEAFTEAVSGDVGEVVLKLAEQPSPLADELRKCGQTLIHGDLRLGNVGFSGDRVVLIDWGERTGVAPPAVELMWLLGFDASRLEVSREEVVAEFRALCRDRFEERALQLAFIGGLVHLACHLGLGLVHAHEEEDRREAEAELAWWTTTAERALETWSP